MSEPSVRSFVKLIIHLNFLIWLVEFEYYFKCEGAAYNGSLPRSEVSALSTMVDQFKSKVELPPISEWYCQYTASNYGYMIPCDNCNGGTDHTECHIIGITMSNLGLSGVIDDAVANLPNLKKLVLSDNKLQGSIPSSLGNLQYLETLDLSNNQLTGTIPWTLGTLRSLKWLYLQNNLLEGSIPPTLGDLNSLEDLLLNFNKLSGSIPEQLGDLVNLITLNLAENTLSGTLPPQLGNLSNLAGFWLPSNFLRGSIPPQFRSLSNIRRFCVAGNYLSGPLPNNDIIKSWPHIQLLSFWGNSFEGKIPVEYFSLPNLTHLLISDLNITSSFSLPETNASIPNIYSLTLRNCSINGSIPSFISQATYITYLDLSFNSLTGGIPDSWVPNLIYMSFAKNNLTGTIPLWIFQATRTRMDLSFNNFTDIASPVPRGLDLNLFSCCCCQNNSIIKPHMLKPSEMMKAYFPAEEKAKFYSLFINCGGEQTINDGQHYDSDNDTLRWHVSSMRNWAYSSSGDFGTQTINSSDYTKRVPCRIENSVVSIFEDARLSPVSLYYYGMSLHEGNYTVTLHFAEIVYSTDADYNRLRKRVFDVYIQGNRVLKDFNIRDQAEGPDKAINRTFKYTEVKESLLEIRFYWTGKGSYDYPPVYNGPLVSAITVTPEFKVGGGLSPLHKALISVASILVALLLLLVLAWQIGLLESKELKKEVQIGEEKTVSPTDEHKEIKVTLKVLINATGKFGDAKKLGSGLLGTVYKAKITTDITVAVKRLNPHYKRKINDLVKEIYCLKSLNHSHLIKLWDVHIGEGLLLLVYEYMENKSLESALFDSKSVLSWETRFKICKGIARGLEALHKHQGLVIVHGNIKSSNILLNEGFEAKLSDFGLANIYSTEEDQFSVIKNEAPKGYQAPEYLLENDRTTETDIYSLGIVLLEIVSGKRNKVRVPGKETESLTEMANSYKGQKILNLVDKRLGSNYVDGQALNVLNLAVMCTVMSKNLRPAVSDVLSVLNGDKTIEQIGQRERAEDVSKDDGDKSSTPSAYDVVSKSDASTSMERT